MSEIIRNWSDMHEDFLIMIAKNLLTIQDLVWFGAVCRQWRSATNDKRQFPLFSKSLFPWVMHGSNKEENKDYRAFFSPLEDKVCANIKLPAALQGCQCWGSPFGWLLTHRLQQEDVEIHILNPFSQTLIRLPSKLDSSNHRRNCKNPLQSMHNAWIMSIAESDSNVYDLKYAIFAVVGDHGDLVFARDGADSWVTIQGAIFTHDVIQFNGAFYTVDRFGFVEIYDLRDGIPVARRRGISKLVVPRYPRFYLVELDGELHMAVRNWSATTFKMIFIQVYRFNGKKGKWEELESLGDNVVFIGRNTSFALKASGYPGCIPDRVYFSTDITDNDQLSKKNESGIGIFSMETRSIEHLYGDDDLASTSCWIMPTIK